MNYNVSVSNLAWTNKDDSGAAELLKRFQIRGLDLVAGRYFNEPWNADVDDWVRVAQWWKSKGFELLGMQSLLFGTESISLFESSDTRKYLLGVFEGIFHRASKIGVKRLVFGSPKHRFLSGDRLGAWQTAVEFFGQLSLMALRDDLFLLIEPNSQRHGCNFLNTTKETAEFAMAVNKSNLGINFDLGAETDNPSFWELDEAELSMIGHIHLSNPDLTELTTFPSNFVRILSALFDTGHTWWTLEQLGHGKITDLPSLERSLEILRKGGLVG
jgi:D-psicose/D-tagatose/L-ribulose 3-epimerase